jgi:5-methylcytosine-specific restriction endonuclease McrA
VLGSLVRWFKFLNSRTARVAVGLHETHKPTTTARERSRMTPILRWQIFERDNFRCVACGHGSADGALLHCDHLIPVSRGGRTIPANLRTLCQACNIGRGVGKE